MTADGRTLASSWLPAPWQSCPRKTYQIIQISQWLITCTWQIDQQIVFWIWLTDGFHCRICNCRSFKLMIPICDWTIQIQNVFVHSTYGGLFLNRWHNLQLIVDRLRALINYVDSWSLHSFKTLSISLFRASKLEFFSSFSLVALPTTTSPSPFPSLPGSWGPGAGGCSGIGEELATGTGGNAPSG